MEKKEEGCKAEAVKKGETKTRSTEVPDTPNFPFNKKALKSQ